MCTSRSQYAAMFSPYRTKLPTSAWRHHHILAYIIGVCRYRAYRVTQQVCWHLHYAHIAHEKHLLVSIRNWWFLSIGSEYQSSPVRGVEGTESLVGLHPYLSPLWSYICTCQFCVLEGRSSFGRSSESKVNFDECTMQRRSQVSLVGGG